MGSPGKIQPWSFRIGEVSHSSARKIQIHELLNTCLLCQYGIYATYTPRTPGVLMSYRSTSFWFDAIGTEPEPRPPLPGDLDVDVVILGAGFSGLWTAYYLAIADPSCRIAVIERDIAGFGASGRNGGWCWPAVQGLEQLHEKDPEGGDRLREAVVASVYEVGNVCEKEDIAADYHRGGGLMIAVDELQAARAREDVAEARAVGYAEDDVQWLEPDEVRQRIRVAANCGGVFQKNIAAVNPAKLARGLADAAERRGVTIYEQTTVTGVEPGRVQTSHGTVRAPRIVMALNAFKVRLPGYKRDVIPVYEHMFATEPFPDQLWDEIGLAPRGLFGDGRRMFTYAQRTADNRIAIGGRSPRYHFGSGIDPRFDRNPSVERELVEALRAMLPQLGNFKVTHRWGGVIAVPRDMISKASFDPKTGIAGIGGFVGEGVAATNLAGRTLCDLLLQRETEISTLPWVGKRSPCWEPEPFRWLGVNAGMGFLRAADYVESRTGRSAQLLDRMMDALGWH
jgi:glycine/D-amino acid oxidase-like deaminating enzyme